MGFFFTYENATLEKSKCRLPRFTGQKFELWFLWFQYKDKFQSKLEEKKHSKGPKNTQKYPKVHKKYPKVPTINKKYPKSPKSAHKKVSKKQILPWITKRYQEVPRNTKKYPEVLKGITQRFRASILVCGGSVVNWAYPVLFLPFTFWPSSPCVLDKFNN